MKHLSAFIFLSRDRKILLAGLGQGVGKMNGSMQRRAGVFQRLMTAGNTKATLHRPFDPRLSLAAIAAGFSLFAADLTSAPGLGHPHLLSNEVR